MSDDDWHDPQAHCLGLRLAGGAIEEVDARGNRIVDDTLLILLNAHHESVTFLLQACRRPAAGRSSSTRGITGKHELRFVAGGELSSWGRAPWRSSGIATSHCRGVPR